MGKLPPFEGKDTAVPKRTPETIRIRHAHCESTELRGEGCAEKLQCRCFECSVAEAMVSALEDQHARFAAVQEGGFQRGLDRIRTGISQDRFAAARTPTLRRSARRAVRTVPLSLSAGCTSPMAWSRRFGDCVRQVHRAPAWRRMTQARHAEPRGEIEEAIAVGIPHIDPPRRFSQKTGPAVRSSIVTFRDSTRRRRAANSRERGPGISVRNSGSIGRWANPFMPIIALSPAVADCQARRCRTGQMTLAMWDPRVGNVADS